MSQSKLSAAAIMDAAARCDLKRVRELLAAGASAKHWATKTKNAVTEACFGSGDGYEKKEAARLAVVGELVAAGCPVDGQALFRPVAEGALEIVQFLIQHGADVNAVSSKEYSTGCTPLGVAIRQGHPDVVAALIAGGADVKQPTGDTIRFGKKFASSPIVEAARWNRPEMIRLLAKAGADLNVIDADNYYGTALLYAIGASRVEVVEQLIASGADANLAAGEKRWLPLALAKEEKQADIVKILESAGACVAKPFESKELLGKAAQEGDVAAVKELIADGADVNATCSFASRDETPLSLAAASGDEQVVKILLDAGAQVDAAGRIGATPLFRAAENGHACVARLLLAAGAEVDVQVKAAYEGKVTPLIAAAERGHEAVVQLLLAAGADARFRTRSGKTPLSAAASEGHVEVVRRLIEAVKQTKNAARALDTPLWWAVYGDHAAVVTLLVAAGANPQATGMYEGKSIAAIDMARKRKKSPVFGLLQQAAAGARQIALPPGNPVVPKGDGNHFAFAQLHRPPGTVRCDASMVRGQNGS